MPALPYRPATLARLAKHLLDHLGHDKVDVSGVSWGGGLAQQFAKQYPRICRKLVLVSTSSGWTMVLGKPTPESQGESKDDVFCSRGEYTIFAALHPSSMPPRVRPPAVRSPWWAARFGQGKSSASPEPGMAGPWPRRRSLRPHKAELGQMSSKHVDKLRTLPNQKLMRSLQGHLRSSDFLIIGADHFSGGDLKMVRELGRYRHIKWTQVERIVWS